MGAEEKKEMTLADALKGYNEEHENRAPSKLRARRLRSTPHTDSGEMIGSGRRVGGKIGRGVSKEIGKSQGGRQHPPQTIPGQGLGGPIQGPQAIGMPPFTPWLHKTKAFVPKMKPGMSVKVGNIIGGPTKILRNKNNKKWNGKIEKQTPPTLFLNKSNYIGLKEKLGKMIHDEVSKQSEGNESMKQVLLSQIIPDPGRDTGLADRKSVV